ncbi:MAG: hypothetical protein KGH71_05460 [Candidatus Micrarchaeota archaeon]|nr:hypothetical protein [Candidatus Micrarchaeota archaeon]
MAATKNAISIDVAKKMVQNQSTGNKEIMSLVREFKGDLDFAVLASTNPKITFSAIKEIWEYYRPEVNGNAHTQKAGARWVRETIARCHPYHSLRLIKRDPEPSVRRILAENLRKADENTDKL